MKRHYGIPGDGFTWKPNCHAHICVGLDEPLDGQVVQARKRGHEPDAGHGGRMSGHETWHKEEGDGQAASGTHGHHHRQPGKSGSADFPGWRGKYHEYKCYHCDMKPDQLLRAILPEVLIDNFDIEGFEKSDTRFDIWLDEKKEQLREDKYNKNIIS